MKKNKVGRPAKGNRRIVAYVTEEAFIAISEEAKIRKMTIGEIVEEAMRTRLISTKS